MQEQACRIAVERGGFLLAWIGLRDPATGQLRIIAHGGADAATLGELIAFYNDPAQGCVFTAQAFATGVPAVCNDIGHDPRTACWRVSGSPERSHVSPAPKVSTS